MVPCFGIGTLEQTVFILSCQTYEVEKFPLQCEIFFSDAFGIRTAGRDITADSFFFRRFPDCGTAGDDMAEFLRRFSIFIDCGVMNGGKLGCLCLENGEEFYV